MNENKTEEKHYMFFQNKECEYFPCHMNINIEEFNCLFCYCPLYSKGQECGGNWHLTKSGKKSCEDCSFPHKKNNYQQVIKKLMKDN